MHINAFADLSQLVSLNSFSETNIFFYHNFAICYHLLSLFIIHINSTN